MRKNFNPRLPVCNLSTYAHMPIPSTGYLEDVATANYFGKEPMNPQGVLLLSSCRVRRFKKILL
jgi:hypothetical protein